MALRLRMSPPLPEKYGDQGECDERDIERDDVACRHKLVPGQIAVVNNGHGLEQDGNVADAERASDADIAALIAICTDGPGVSSA